jgi:hypothetical protein
MVAVFFDSMDDDAKRRDLYRGDLFVFSPRPATLALVEHAREMIEDAFAGKDPRTALIQAMLADLGCEPEATYFDVPRLRTMTNGDYLKAGYSRTTTWRSTPASSSMIRRSSRRNAVRSSLCQRNVGSLSASP